MARVAGIGEAFPEGYHHQKALLAALQETWRPDDPGSAKLARLFASTGVEGRHLALPLEQYSRPRTFGENNRAWMRIGEEIGASAVRDALERAGMRAADIDAFLFVSVTGLATPSLDARLINRLGFRNDVKRIPIFGLGCVAGAACLARAAEIARKGGNENILVLSVELCSLTFRLDDRSGANMVAAGLFGDGAAAVVLTADGRGPAGPSIVASRSIFYPGTEEIMGWDVSEQGLRLVLSPGIPALIRDHLGGDVDRFLRDQGLGLDDIGTWVCHTGGPRILLAIQETLGLPPEALAGSWERLRSVGNVSSASVLQVLRRSVEAGRSSGTSRHGLLLALGPGFCCELVLLRWPESESSERERS